MSLDKLLTQIAEDAEREIKAIRAEAEAKAAAIEAEARAREEHLWQRENEVLRRRLHFAASQERSAREVKSKRRLLHEREVLLEELRQRFVQWLNHLPAAQETALLHGLWQRGVARVPRGILIANARTREILGEATAAFRWQEEAISGMRLISEDGCIAVDLTYPTLVAEFWQRQRSAAARALLGEERFLGEPPA
ncbi:MAG: V-type ATP synthase subunit E [Planctomycetota bacterium]|nr:V-type ATP synthase subunit E [Planctomycetota bacterium]